MSTTTAKPAWEPSAERPLAAAELFVWILLPLSALAAVVGERALTGFDAVPERYALAAVVVAQLLAAAVLFPVLPIASRGLITLGAAMLPAMIAGMLLAGTEPRTTMLAAAWTFLAIACVVAVRRFVTGDVSTAIAHALLLAWLFAPIVMSYTAIEAQGNAPPIASPLQTAAAIAMDRPIGLVDFAVPILIAVVALTHDIVRHRSHRSA